MFCAMAHAMNAYKADKKSEFVNVMFRWMSSKAFRLQLRKCVVFNV